MFWYATVGIDPTECTDPQLFYSVLREGILSGACVVRTGEQRGVCSLCPGTPYQRELNFTSSLQHLLSASVLNLSVCLIKHLDTKMYEGMEL